MASGSVAATAGHPFWSASEVSWVDAGDLDVGDAVLELDGSVSVVTATSEVTVQATVHNLTVADIHTYFVFVGDSPTLVDNCGGAGPVRLGQQGEDAVRAVEEIGDKAPFLGASGQSRIADGLVNIRTIPQ